MALSNCNLQSDPDSALWDDCVATESSGTIRLTGGQIYPVVMEYYENTQSASAALSWSSPSTPRQVIPQSAFRVGNYHMIGAMASAGCSITPAGGVWVAHGGSQSFVISNAPGWRLSDVQVDGQSLGTILDYTFNNVTDSHSIAATAIPILPPSLASPSSALTIAPGPFAIMGVTMNGTPPFSYRWLRDGVVLAGETNRSCVATGNSQADAVFKVIVTNEAGRITNNFVVAFPSSATEATAVVGQPAILAIVTNGAPVPAIQWLCNDMPVPNATNASLIIPQTTAADEGAGFHAVISNMFGCVTSAVTTLRLNCAIDAEAETGGTINPQGRIIVPIGASRTFSMAPLSGYGITDVLVDDVSMGAISTLSLDDITSCHTILARFGVAPAITNQPQSRVVLSGEPVSFVVGSSGYPLTYQWLHDGMAISGETNATLDLSAATTSDTTTALTVRVWNPLGSVTSSVATLTVLVPEADEDGDGISNAWELEVGTNPLMADTDGDGLSDGDELDQYHTNPLLPDTDFDGLTDGVEVRPFVVAWTPSGVTILSNHVDGVALSSSDTHTVMVLSNGTVQAWNNGDLLGMDVPPEVTGVVSVAASYYCSMALRNDGHVLVWGGNGFNQLDIPEDLSNVIAVAAGELHCLALRDDGTVVGWGGDGLSTVLPVPPSATNIIAIAAGAYHSLALRDDGTVMAWGDDFTEVPNGLSNVTAIAAGQLYDLALLSDGTVFNWGANLAMPPGLSNVVKIAVARSGSSAFAITSDGKIHGWGAAVDCPLPYEFSAVDGTGGGGALAITLLNTSPLVPDMDDDRIDDGDEVRVGSDPRIPNGDTDGDGLPDWWEIKCGLNFRDASDALLDADDDGLNNTDEFQYGTDPQNPDKDEDGLSDGDEVLIWLTNPLMADTDGDDIPDGWEVENGMDPADPSDAAQDPDGDNLDNLQEYFLRTNVLYGASSDPNKADTDGDGICDGEEIARGLNPLVSDLNVDHDGDGLDFDTERWLGTDPFDRDSDGDGFDDYDELYNHLEEGFDPNVYNPSDTNPNPEGYFITISMSETKQGPDYDDPIGRCLLTFDNGTKTCRVWRADDGTNGYAARTFFLPAGYTCGMALIDSRPNDTNICGITLGLAVNGKAIPPSMLNDPAGIFSLPITFPLPPDSGESSMVFSRSVQMSGFNSGASAPATLSGASLNLPKVTICYRNTTVEVPDNASLCAGNTILVTAVVQPPGMAGALTWLQNNAPDNTYDAEISAMENGVTFVPEGAASDDWGVTDRVFLAIGQVNESGYSWNNPDASVHRTTLPTGSESWGGGTLPYNMDNDNSNESPDMDEQGVAHEDDLALGISFGSWGAQWDCEGGFTGPAPVGKVTVQGPARLRGLGEQDNPSGPMLGSSHDMEDGGTVELEGTGLSSAINDVTVLEQTTDAGITTLDNTLNYTVFRVDVLGDINHDEHVDKDDRLFAESQNVTSLFMGCGTNKLTKVLLRTELGLASGQMTLMSGGVRLWSVPHPGPNDVPFLAANTTTNWSCTAPQEYLLLYAEGVTPGLSEIVYSCRAGSNGPWFESRLAVTVIKVEFKELGETFNRLNQVFNATPKDDPPPTLANKIYVVESPDSLYHVTLDVDDQPASMRSKLMYAVFVDGAKISGSDGFYPATGPANIIFDHPSLSVAVEKDFELRVGYDLNGNSVLDSTEEIPLFVKNTAGTVIGSPIARGTSSPRYPVAMGVVDAAVLDTVTLPHASRLLQIFRDGAATGLPTGKAPTATIPVTFNCYSDQWALWLTHNAGAQFNASGTASIQYYVWGTNTSLADLTCNSYQMKPQVEAFYNGTVLPVANAFFATNPIGTIATFPLDGTSYNIPHTDESPSWVTNYLPGVTVTFDNPYQVNGIKDDINGTLGRGRIISHTAKFTFEKKIFLGVEYVDLTRTRVKGVVEDLYDFNRDGGGAGEEAAIIQLGHGNGSYGPGRTFGVIYRNKIEIDQDITF